MAKRFTDTEKWEDPFFLDMPNDFKLVYNYILDKCDSVGVWKVNKRLVEFSIGKIDWDMFVSYMGERLFVINDEKWWITKFCDFQYGDLSEDSTSKPVQSYIKQLKKHTLWKGYAKGIHTLKEKEKDKEKEKEEDKNIKYYRKFAHLKMTYDELETLLSENYSKPEIDAVLDDLENYRQNTKYKSMVKTARNWLKKRKTNIVQPVQTFNSYKLGPEYDN